MILILKKNECSLSSKISYSRANESKAILHNLR